MSLLRFKAQSPTSPVLTEPVPMDNDAPPFDAGNGVGREAPTRSPQRDIPRKRAFEASDNSYPTSDEYWYNMYNAPVESPHPRMDRNPRLPRESPRGHQAFLRPEGLPAYYPTPSGRPPAVLMPEHREDPAQVPHCTNSMHGYPHSTIVPDNVRPPQGLHRHGGRAQFVTVSPPLQEGVFIPTYDTTQHRDVQPFDGPQCGEPRRVYRGFEIRNCDCYRREANVLRVCDYNASWSGPDLLKVTTFYEVPRAANNEQYELELLWLKVA